MNISRDIPAMFNQLYSSTLLIYSTHQLYPSTRLISNQLNPFLQFNLSLPFNPSLQSSRSLSNRSKSGQSVPGQSRSDLVQSNVTPCHDRKSAGRGGQAAKLGRNQAKIHPPRQSLSDHPASKRLPCKRLVRTDIAFSCKIAKNLPDSPHGCTSPGRMRIFTNDSQR